MKRDEVQAAHEAAVLESFIEYQASLGKEMKVVDTPDPPDAIVTIDGKETWIELTNAWLDRRLAESVTSYAAEDKEHKGLPQGNRMSFIHLLSGTENPRPKQPSVVLA